MKNFQKNNRWKRVSQSKIALILLGVLVLFFAYNMYGFWGKMQETRKNKQIAENKIAELEKGKEKLSSDIEKLKTEQGQEATIRQKFGLVKEGEGMIVVVDEKPPLAANAVTPSGGFFNFLKNLFK